MRLHCVKRCSVVGYVQEVVGENTDTPYKKCGVISVLQLKLPCAQYPCKRMVCMIVTRTEIKDMI